LVKPRQLDLQDYLIEEQQRALRLILRRRRNLSSHGQMSQECFDFLGTQFRRVTLAVEKNEAFNPIDVGLLGPQAVVFPTDLVADAVQ